MLRPLSQHHRPFSIEYLSHHHIIKSSDKIMFCHSPGVTALNEPNAITGSTVEDSIGAAVAVDDGLVDGLTSRLSSAAA